MNLTELQKDAITELFNIGMGAAADSLSQMVGEEVILAVPRVEIMLRSDAIAKIRQITGNQVTGIREHFKGSFRGDALLLFPEEQSLELVRAILKEDLSLDMLSELEQEALIELGNIILNACLGNLTNMFGSELSYELPTFTRGNCEEVVTGKGTVDSVMLLQMDFSLQKTDAQGYLTLMMDVESAQSFFTHIDKMTQSVT